MNAKQISSASTADLLAFFNGHAAKPVARFSDRKTAERRVAALVAEMINHRDCPGCGAGQGTGSITAAGAEGTAAGERNFCHRCGTEWNPNTGKVWAAPAASAARSEGVAASWADPAVRAKRCERTSVVVRGPKGFRRSYKSVAAAFRDIGLPPSRIIPFRMELKAKGSLPYGNDYLTFSVA